MGYQFKENQIRQNNLRSENRILQQQVLDEQSLADFKQAMVTKLQQPDKSIYVEPKGPLTKEFELVSLYFRIRMYFSVRGRLNVALITAVRLWQPIFVIQV